MAEVFVKPAPGRFVRDPLTLAPLAAEGERKPRSSYWLKRLRDGDVIETDVKPKAPRARTGKETD
ncbi:hypothetical protein AN401_11730 [Zobellella denitrificans]|uniref:DUF2635 domain-containing protein n=1 Tax=Zobellella denitrificans TaxID=347534 RepID=A0A291HQW2_9GAMM|nr:DUF2635 domain-containing protein [Zobellella denitrificans]ATG74328.1 hypothetical protein AN401_11030 [Zobellella denitrificans]ATG74441.1 hypothetical protein AN401_11730 [Zobellella denitrificans]